jgi:hypothetical protein
MIEMLFQTPFSQNVTMTKKNILKDKKISFYIFVKRNILDEKIFGIIFIFG